MKKIFAKLSRISLLILFTIAILGCDQMEKVASSGGSSNAEASESESAEIAKTEIAKKGDSEPENVQLTKVRLNAFQHFKCTNNWGNRDGGLGLKAGTGSGSCRAEFPGHAGDYRVTLMAQLEFDGAPKFKIMIDGKVIAAGEYPMSKGKLICDCPNWRTNCPDRVIPIDAGTHPIKKGSTIEFYGEEVYPCGSGSHGAYAKWREIVFTPN